ncbi:protein phosphatase 1 regulatory subunit 12B isoform X1 [Malaclemys terrapin pileata]|uniref:protein phosphatase 1 regulatory subunit 12B isoform X1 n=1 Tax=Malaclemys terrapin pileata TaxID=2991368 RepID=UPI0023A8310C|nr:protein phosphatase 1 regulatory subunit 12B isoform X1 [Malaclemys terrapin pileata]
MSEPGHLGVKRAESARLRRAEQLRRWKGSLTELEPVGARGRHRGGGAPRVRFEEGAVFLAACSSGDAEEVKRLLARGARINTANVDGLTALHQACIDENLDMVKFLVENGASVNQQDNEGWTPLHAVASCGYLNIAEYLLSHGANVAAVNSEGEVPSDLAEEAAMKDLLLEQVKKQGVDLDLARKEEEQQMLQDARQWLNSGKLEDIKQPRSGATALHVAAAKGYSEVMRLLIQAGFNLNVQDNDGWTPLHAAAHWGVKEACTILAEALCDMDIRNKLGQTPFDVADEGLVEHLEMLQKKQNVLRSEKETRNKLIEADMNGKLQSGLFKNKEKILYEEDTLKSREPEEENKESSSSSSEEEEEAEEDEASESDAEKEAERKKESFANHSSHEPRTSVTEQVPPPEHNSFTAAPARKFTSLLNKSEEQKDESPSSWRLGLRKTGSHNMLSEAASREALRERGSSIYRSSSSPRISALLDNKEKDKDSKNYFAPITPRRLSSTGDIEEKENRESAVNLVRSGSYTRQPWRDEPKGNEAPQTGAPSTYVSTYLKSASFGRSSDLNSPYISANRNTSATSPTTIGSSTSLGTQWQPASSCPTSLSANTTASIRQHTRATYRQQTDSTIEKNTENISASTPLGVITNRTLLNTANGVTSANATSTTGTDSSNGEVRERRRSYLTPVRDEEAESLRKARSRQARQTRRSTQGVTLTDLQEAERTFSRSRVERQAQEQQSEKPESTEDSSERREETRPWWNRNQDEESVYRRLRCPAQTDKPTTPVSPSTSAPSLYASSHLARTNRSLDPDSVNPADFQSTATEMEKNECEDQDLDDRSPNKQSIRERRRPKERRRGTGISFWTKDDDEVDGNEEVKESRHERLSRLESAGTSPTTSDSYSDRASSRSSAYTRRENRLASLSSRTEEETNRDYKKLYEGALSENQKLKSKLQEAQLELADIKSKLEKAAQQKQEKTSDRSSMLEMEKRGKRALERRLSEMEEEMKVSSSRLIPTRVNREDLNPLVADSLGLEKQVLTELKSDNQRLKDENGALIRVISKLSK